MTSTDDKSKASTGSSTLMSNIKLVQEVRKRPALYDPRKRGYKDGSESDKAWLQIANEMGLKPIDVRNRWRALRDKFVREKKRLVLDGEASYRSRDPWPLLDEMSFLWDFIYHRKDVYIRKMSAKVRAEYIQRNMQPILPRPSPEWVNVAFDTPEASPSHAMGNSGATDSADNAFECESVRIKRDPGDREDNYIDTISPPSSKLRYLLDSTMHQDESSEDTPQIGTSNDNSTLQKITQDEDELFCLSVASTLRRFSYQKKALAKLRIQQILYDVEFQQTPSNHSVSRLQSDFNTENVYT